jgi:sulfite reductase (NADPH) flavoprotein alpha-component
MQNAGLLPQTAPFPDDDRANLDRILGDANPVQRAWLAGFLAGVDVAERPAVPASQPQRAEPLAILFASESGNSERLADTAAKAARKLGFKPRLIDFADLNVADLVAEKRIIVIAATWGEGEPPARAIRAYQELMAPEAPRLDGITFGVLALGDTAYAEFCSVGKAIDARLEELGAQRTVARVDCDLDFETSAATWIKDTLDRLAPPRDDADNVVAVDFKARTASDSARGPLVAEVAEHINLNSSRSAKETIHLALSFDGGAPVFEPGDSLDLFPQNNPVLADAVLAATGLSSDEPLRSALIAQRDITTLSVATLEKLAASTGHAGIKALLSSGQARTWVQGRQLIDALEEFSATLAAEQLVAATRPLPPRAYSIASSLKEFPAEAHLLVSAVRYESQGRARAGVASTFIADRVCAGTSVRARVKPNKHFRLPNPATDVIMVGPGTGIAPFRAFVQERRATGANGRSWLFFGDRQYTHDFLYQLEWQDALADKSLTRLDLAFSRDQPQKIYVQHRLWERRKDIVDWLEGGAHFYVCGDANAMAKDVRAALVAAYADVKSISPDAAESAVAELDRGRRYLQDVY